MRHVIVQLRAYPNTYVRMTYLPIVLLRGKTLLGIEKGKIGT